MITRILSGIIIFILCWPGFAAKVAEFDQFGRPEGLIIGNGYIYIQEGVTIFVYDLKDYKLVTKFGKEGEGPGEIKKNLFAGPIAVSPHQGKVIITSSAKVSVFSATGKFLEEHKINQFDIYYPFADKYILMASTPSPDNPNKQLLALFLADKNFKKDKLLYISDLEVGMNVQFDFPINPFYPDIEEDKAYILAGKYGFAIDVFDTSGKKLFRISKDEKKQKVSQDYIDKTINWFKTSPNYREAYEPFFKNRISFKKFFPPVYTYWVENNRIYVLTYKMKKDLRECIIMDLKGKEIKRIHLQAPTLYGLDYGFYFDIHQNHFYSLKENINEDLWELHKQKVE